MPGSTIPPGPFGHVHFDAADAKGLADIHGAIDLVNGMSAAGMTGPAVFSRLVLAIRVMHGGAPSEVRAVIEEHMRQALALLYEQPLAKRVEK